MYSIHGHLIKTQSATSLESPAIQTKLSKKSISLNKIYPELFLSTQFALFNTLKNSLGSNSLYGIVTEELSNCTKLQYLDLGMNSFTGRFPDLSSLTQLKFLNLNHSGFSGQFPWKSLENLTSLEFLSLGEILEGIGNLTLLQNLELSYNQLSGKIPEGITKLKNLWQLELYSNQLFGKLPNGFGNLTNLINFDASTNSLEGDLSEIKYLTKLISLQLFENKFSGEKQVHRWVIGKLFELLVVESFTSKQQFTFRENSCWNLELAVLSIIDLTVNQFEGPLSDNVGEAKSLAQLFFSHNQFSSELPATISESTSLVDIELGSNQFSGEIPATIGNLKKLSNLHLENNLFSASIGSLRSLNFLNLSHNETSREIPVSLSSLKLSILDLSNNRLMGRIPDSLSIEAFVGGFARNRAMCCDGCLICVTCIFHVKYKYKAENQDCPIKRYSSLDMKQFHMLSFTEEEVMNAIKKENLISKDSGDRRSCRSSSAMIRKGNLQLLEYDAEVATLSSIRHVNVVKLYYCITSKDWNLLVYKYLPNGSLWDRLHTCQKIEIDWEVR
ncbi:hypothetical protein ACSBR1_019466 [Camellia fascicularis]